MRRGGETAVKKNKGVGGLEKWAQSARGGEGGFPQIFPGGKVCKTSFDLQLLAVTNFTKGDVYFSNERMKREGFDFLFAQNERSYLYYLL